MITPDIVVKAVFLIGSFFIGFVVGIHTNDNKKEATKQQEQEKPR